MYNERGEKTCECRPKETFFPRYERGELDGEECMAYTADEQCLKKAMLEDCQVAFDPSKDYGADDVSDCEFAYGFVIESVIKYKNHFCGKR
jgi:hypothetical protein